jgi:hypothetical protein
MSQKSSGVAEEPKKTIRTSRDSDEISDISQDSESDNTSKPCNRGPGCFFLSKGTCRYYHSLDEVFCVKQKEKIKPKEKPPCRSGSNCPFLLNGKCIYFHPKHDIAAMHRYKNSNFRQASRKTK